MGKRLKNIWRLCKKLTAHVCYGAFYLIFRPKPFESLPGRDVQQACAERFRSDMERAPRGGSGGKAASPTWNSFLDRLRDESLLKEPLSFVKWPVVRITMFCEPSFREWRSVRQSRIWKDHRDALSETAVGSPKPFVAYPASSGNLIHQAYHIVELLKAYDADIGSMKSILEIGGGYGTLCRFLYKMGFAGRYVIFDFPEILALQRYFLSMTGICDKGLIELVSDTPSIGRAKDADLAIMTWSLSEMPISTRDAIMANVGRPAYFLIAYHKDHDGMDNRAYFTRFKNALPGYSWKEYEIPHLRRNYYLIGKRG